jgi:hypothetical protein
MVGSAGLAFIFRYQFSVVLPKCRKFKPFDLSENSSGISPVRLPFSDFSVPAFSVNQESKKN